MAIRDLIPWNRGGDVSFRESGEGDPFLTLHREVNRLFENALRGFDMAPLGRGRFFGTSGGWPNIEVSETGGEIKVTAELPGLEEKDVHVELADNVLSIRGEKRTETEDKDRLFSERYYGQFERRIPVDDVDKDKVSASFKNGLLTVTMPKTPDAKGRLMRIPINGK